MSQATDQYLMMRVLDGQVELFDELVKRHRASMLRAAVSKMRNQATAEDVVQDTFLAAFARRVTFDPQYSFRGWLWTILLNTARTQLTLDRRRYDRLAEVATNIARPVTTETGLDLLLRVEQSELLEQFLGELPEAEADALRLRFFGGLQFDEIAQAMAISLNGARKRVCRGLERLAGLLRKTQSIGFDGETR